MASQLQRRIANLAHGIETMPILSHETYHVQNPALGAVLLWRFATGYAQGSTENTAPPLPLLFIVLPILLHAEMQAVLTSTLRSSGLRKCFSKLSESKMSKSDLLYGIHKRASDMRNLTMDSLGIALSSKLIAIEPERAIAIPLTVTRPRFGIQQSVQSIIEDAEKLGFWCSQVSIYEVSNILKVRF